MEWVRCAGALGLAVCLIAGALSPARAQVDTIKLPAVDYAGEVRPITEPVFLRYTPVRKVNMTVVLSGDFKAASGNARPFSEQTRLEWTTRAGDGTAGETVFDLRMYAAKTSSGNADGQVIRRGRDDGTFTDSKQTSPYAEAQGFRLEPSTPRYRSIANFLARWPLPFGPAVEKAGDPVYALDLPAYLARTSPGLLEESPSRRLVASEGGVTAEGLTSVKGRPALLVRVAARATFEDQGVRQEFTIDGYHAIDQATGLTAEKAERVGMESHKDGARTLSGYFLQKSTTRF